MKASSLKNRFWKVFLVAGVLATSTVFASGCESMDRAEAVRVMNRGLEAHELGRTADAIQDLKEAAQIDPTYSEPAYYLGQIYHLKLSELDNAQHYYREALNRDEGNPQIAYRLGTVLYDQQDWSGAEGFFQQAVSKENDFAKAWFRLGLAQERQAKWAEAVDSYMSSIRANPRMQMDAEDPGGQAYHALGDLYIRFGFYDKALQVYENGIANNDLDARPKKPAHLYQGKGVALLKDKKFPEAADAFKKALELDGTMYTAIFNLAVTHTAMGKTEEALAGFAEFNQRADVAKDEARIVAAEGWIQKINEKAEAQAEQ